MNYTIKDLRQDLVRLNDSLASSGSTYCLQESGRNGYQAIDTYHVEPDGSANCSSFLVGGTSRECYEAAKLYVAQYLGYIYPQKKADLTRAQAKRVLTLGGVDFKKDFFQLSSWDVDKLVTWAKLTQYRKPPNANGSRGRYFFAHLQKKVKI